MVLIWKNMNEGFIKTAVIFSQINFLFALNWTERNMQIIQGLFLQEDLSLSHVNTLAKDKPFLLLTPYQCQEKNPSKWHIAVSSYSDR